MKKIAVVYLSKCGHTKKYVDWLKEEVADVDVIAVTSFNFTRMLEYKLVIFACGIYGDKLAIMDSIRKNIVSVPTQKTMVMAVGWYTNDSEDAKQKLIAENYPEQFKGNVPLYVVNSGLDKKQLSMGDKAALLVAQRSIEKKDGRSTDDINALAIIKGYSDQTSKDNLASILAGINEFFNPGANAPAAAAAKPAAPKPAPATPKPAAPAKPADELSDSVEAAFKNLKAAKPAPKAPSAQNPAPAPTPAPEPAPAPEAEAAEPSAPVVRFNSKGEVVVSSVVAAINSLNNEDIMGTANTAANPIAEVIEEVKTIAAERPAPKPAPAPAPAAPKPAADEDPLSASVEAAFKNLNAPKAAPKPAPKPEAAPKPTITEDSLSASVEEAFKHLNAPKAAPKPAPAPAPAAEAAPAEEVIHTEPAPVTPEPAAETIPEPAQEPAPAPRKNSYMEMFAKRRRATSSETESAAPSAPEPAPAPAEAAKPEPAPVQRSAYEAFTSPQVDFDLNALSMDMEEQAEAVSEPEQSAAIGDFDMEEDVYDFLDESAHVGSKRALTAVEDLAKAKIKAEQEAARLAAAKHAETVEEDDEPAGYEESARPAPIQRPAQAQRPATAQQNDILEKMRHDIEALAEESENVSASQHQAEYQQDEYQTEYQQESEPEYSEPEYAGSAPEEEKSDGLEAFAFTDSTDYDLEAEFVEPEPEPVDTSHMSKTNIDIMKLQEEINASIESNRAAKEKMIARQNRQKTESVNPFLVQFEEEDDKKKKKEPERKKLDDPIDPDIFFSRQSNKGSHTAPGVMPEIKFRNH